MNAIYDYLGQQELRWIIYWYNFLADFHCPLKLVLFVKAIFGSMVSSNIDSILAFYLRRHIGIA